MLKIRLRRMGAKKAPFYRIIVADSRAPRDGAFRIISVAVTTETSCSGLSKPYINAHVIIILSSLRFSVFLCSVVLFPVYPIFQA